MRMEDTRLPKCVMSEELVGARAAWGARKKSGWGVSWTTSEPSASTPTIERMQPRTRGRMARDGGTRGGTFHGELYRCRESQGWTTPCSGMPERDGKNQGGDNPKASGPVLVRSP